MRRLSVLSAVVAALVASTTAAAAAPESCPSVDVPGAERQESACLPDLTTAGTRGTRHTDESDWSGLHASGTSNPSGVPGLQVDGYFPDTSRTNTTHGWNHDAQFVIRLPQRWNGKLVVTGAPGVRKQYAVDFLISDWVLDRGYAFASTDKGNTGIAFHTDGERPGDAVAEWHRRVTELATAAKDVVAQRYGRAPERTYVTGISNGGYLTRWQLENRPELYDGGVDWEGTLFRADGPNLFTFLPPALRAYPFHRLGSRTARDEIIAAGFAPESEPLWDEHYLVYWDLTQRTFREEFDPGYDGPLQGGFPFCPQLAPGCDTGYDYATRPQEVRDAVGRVSLTGRTGRPLITLHGTLDTLLPIKVDSDVYAELVRDNGADHRYYRIDGGGHVDGMYDRFPQLLRPILPCYRDAFVALESWVERGAAPPPDATLPRPAGGDLVNTCEL